MALHGSLTRAIGPGFGFLILVTGCSHQEPFQAENPGNAGSFDGGAQLTYNLGADLGPAWLPDGSGVVYSFENLSDPFRDRCLAIMPKTGGTRQELPCGTSATSPDSVDAFLEARPGPNGQMLFVRQTGIGGALTPLYASLQLSSIERPDIGRTLRPYPYTASNGKVHTGIDQIQWLSPTSAIYLATSVSYPEPCPGCPPDTVRTGIELVEVDFSGATPAVQPIPNTEDASSVAVGASGNDVYFTKNGNSRVYHLDRSTGSLIPVHDFGSAGVARDLIVVGSQVIAVVGGDVVYSIDPIIGNTQVDRGGDIWVADLGSGTQTQLFIDAHRFRHLARSPSGSQILAESFAMTFTDCGFQCIDTLVSRIPDIWLLDTP